MDPLVVCRCRQKFTAKYEPRASPPNFKPPNHPSHQRFPTRPPSRMISLAFSLDSSRWWRWWAMRLDPNLPKSDYDGRLDGCDCADASRGQGIYPATPSIGCSSGVCPVSVEAVGTRSRPEGAGARGRPSLTSTPGAASRRRPRHGSTNLRTGSRDGPIGPEAPRLLKYEWVSKAPCAG